ncbi:DUF1499 domain-containing protein, partial [Desulfovibrio inopinatus]|uniref:DUF1499 domain-containing protein n=1 Tax=Desulfovibrio inopinatus TaxID=102109 RepID=UPI000552073D
MTKASFPTCPSRPNCVNSKETHPRNAILPLTFDETQESRSTAWKRLRSVVLAIPGTQLIEESTDRLVCTVTSHIFKFIDDVIFVMRPDASVIDVHSASRIGYWDLGANRKRIERIRRIFEHNYASKELKL